MENGRRSCGSVIIFFGTIVSVLGGTIAAHFALGRHSVSYHTARTVHSLCRVLDKRTEFRFFITRITSVWFYGGFL